MNTSQPTGAAEKRSLFKPSVAFVVLFLLYHGAEYMIVFRNNASGFLGVQALFFGAALVLGTWYRRTGLTAWGLPFSGPVWKPLLTGVLLGIAVYAVPYFVALAFGIERVVSVPDGATIIKATLPFAFGVLFSSFSEDVLTRGLPYACFHKKLGVYTLVTLSAVLYVLNHIYRLNDGPAALLYLFLLGVVYVLPLVYTGNLWLTGGMHWAGNVFFFATHNVIQTEEYNPYFSSNYLFATWLVLCIPLVWLFCKRLVHRPGVQAA
jgi:uncharacterized protein